MTPQASSSSPGPGKQAPGVQTVACYCVCQAPRHSAAQSAQSSRHAMPQAPTSGLSPRRQSLGVGRGSGVVVVVRSCWWWVSRVMGRICSNYDRTPESPPDRLT
eukprot:3689657-Prymnesium_polylepis.2